jgi:hypothetical protein
MTITNVTCNATCSGIQDDNVFLLIQADGGPPSRYPAFNSIKMGPGDTMTLPDGGYVVNFEDGVVVTAWDLDAFIFKIVNAPDYLFNIWVYYDTQSATETKYNNNGARYTFTRDISA